MFHATSFNTSQRYKYFGLLASVSGHLRIIFIVFAVRVYLRRVWLICVRSVPMLIQPCEIKGLIC